VTTRWICIDCTAECTNREHAWAQCSPLQLPDGSEAWLFEPDPQEEPETTVPHPWSLPCQTDPIVPTETPSQP